MPSPLSALRDDAPNEPVVLHAAGARRPTPSSSVAWPLSLGAILLLTFIAYVPSLSNGFTNWDDNIYVTRNPLLVAPSWRAILTTPVNGHYSPLTIGTFALNHALSGNDAGSYHWLNLLLHLLNTALVFIFVRRLSAGRFWTTVLTASFFGIHPMHVESVAWIAERKDVLYACFYLVGLIAYLRYVGTSRRSWLMATFAAFVLSAASKPAAMVFPLTLLAVDHFHRRGFHRPVLLEKLPFFVISGIVGVVTFHGQATLGALDRNLQYGAAARLLFAGYGLVMYVVKALVPIGLSAIYPVPLAENGALGWPLYLSVVVLLVALPALILAVRGRPALLFGVTFFFINVMLVLQFVTVGQAVMADRFTYLPYVGLFFGLTWWLDTPARSASASARARSLVACGLLLLLPVCLVQTWMRCKVWKDSGTLWTDVIDRYPHRIAAAYNNRGDFHQRRGDLPAALADYDQALALTTSHAELWVSKGNVLFDLGRLAEAVACYDRALALSPERVYPLERRGAAKVRLGDFAGAVSDFSRAIALNPGDRDAYSERGIAYLGLRQHEQAVADWRRVIALAPRDPSNHFFYNAIGLSLQALGKHDDAVAAFSQAITLAPGTYLDLGHYYFNRSVSWAAVGDAARRTQDVRSAAALGYRAPGRAPRVSR